MIAKNGIPVKWNFFSIWIVIEMKLVKMVPVFDITNWLKEHNPP